MEKGWFSSWGRQGRSENWGSDENLVTTVVQEMELQENSWSLLIGKFFVVVVVVVMVQKQRTPTRGLNSIVDQEDMSSFLPCL